MGYRSMLHQRSYLATRWCPLALPRGRSSSTNNKRRDGTKSSEPVRSQTLNRDMSWRRIVGVCYVDDNARPCKKHSRRLPGPRVRRHTHQVQLHDLLERDPLRMRLAQPRPERKLELRPCDTKRFLVSSEWQRTRKSSGWKARIDMSSGPIQNSR